MKKSDELKIELNEIKAKAEKLSDSDTATLEEIKACTSQIKNIKNKIDEAESEEEEERNDIENKMKNGGGIQIKEGFSEGGQNVNKLKNFKDGEIRMFNKGETFYSKGGEAFKEQNPDIKLSMQKYLRGAVTGNWNNASHEMEQFKALSTSTGTVLIPSVLSDQVINKIVNQSILLNGGAVLVDMQSNSVTVPVVKENPKFGFKQELVKATPSEMTFDSVELKSKTLYGLVKISLELLESSTADQVILNAMSESAAETLDQAFLLGDGEIVGDKQITPKGILTYDTINKIDATSITGYKPFQNALGAIMNDNANVDTCKIAMNSKTMLHTDSLTDTTGQPLREPKLYEKVEKVVSNQLPTVENKAIAMAWQPQSVLIGLQTNFRLEIGREIGFEDGSVTFRIYCMGDVVPTRPKRISKIENFNILEA